MPASSSSFKTPPFSWKIFWLNYLFFFSFSGIHQSIIYFHGQSGFNGLRQAVYMSFLFIIWRSDSWQKQNQLFDTQNIEHRAYSSSDFIYTWSDLAGIDFKGFDPSRSIVNQLFSEHPIWIGDPYNPKALRDLRKQPF